MRTFIFNLSFYVVTAVMSVAFLFLLIFPQAATVWISKVWGGISLWLIKHVCGIQIEIRGKENMLPAPAIFASKHQSALDTIILHMVLERPAFVLKKQLLFLPFFGLYLIKIGSIAIDRKAGAAALKAMVKQTKERLEAKHSVVIFPEGTRTPPDAEDTDFHPGVAALYSQLDVTVVPVALNSGVCWRRNAYNKKSGTVIVEFMEPIQTGQLDRKSFIKELKTRINTQSKVLVAEGEQEQNQKKLSSG